MFTGIIEAVGTVLSLTKGEAILRLSLSTPGLSLSLGDSLAINGCCLTVTEAGEENVSVEVVLETLSKTNLSDLEVGSLVNLETSLTLQKGLSGHLVQGHVDGVGKIADKILLAPDSWLFSIKTSKKILDLMIEKGSITVEGVSLTIIEVRQDSFSFTLIPYSSKHTTLGEKKVGERVNLEVDLMAKYIKKWLT